MKFTSMSIQENIKLIYLQLDHFKDQINSLENMANTNSMKIQQSFVRIEELESNSVFKQNYSTDISEIQDKTNRALYWIEDVSKNLDATDNYIQKYFPVKIQDLINETLMAVSKTDEEREAILNYEIKKYKDFHKIVIKDEGSPCLKKKEFKYPSFIEIEKNLKKIKINQMKKEEALYETKS